MNLIGKSVKHAVFGTGTVTDLSENILTICFEDGNKKFIYPDAFEQFLVLTDKEAMLRIQSLLKDHELAKQKKKEEELAAQERRLKIQTFKVLANSHVIFNLSPEQRTRLDSVYELSTGTYLSGYSKGLPRIAGRIKPNSACMLTWLPKGKSEEERIILGIFMVKEDYFGEDVQNGIIELHPKYRILFSEEKPLFFWKYIDQDIPQRWGNLAYKYCSGSVIQRILGDVVEQSEANEEKEVATDLYLYFCKMNRIPPFFRFQKKITEEKE